MKRTSRALKQKLAPLRAYVEEKATVHFGLGRVFAACLRSSFVRAFEFVDIASSQRDDSAFFLAPGLRGITEDIIYLRFLSKLPNKDREKIVMGLMLLEVHGKLKHQHSFFRIFRPFQPVLPEGFIDIAGVSDNVRSIWRAYGWPGLNSISPPTREIAEKSDPGLLEVVYDFIYRLTSGVVHFNPQVLLRAGWGPTKTHTTFSSKNMGPYYLAMCQLYGGYLLCLHFELFGRFLKQDKKIKTAVSDLREYLLETFRWPEMVTYEEMNKSVPQPSGISSAIVYSFHKIIMKEGFMHGAKEFLKNKG